MTNSSSGERSTDPDHEVVRESLLKIEAEIFQAITSKDSSALDLVLDQNFMYRNFSGGDLTRAQFLENIRALPVTITSIWGEHLQVDVYGDTAVLTGLQKAKVVDIEGKAALSSVAFADIFVTYGDDWKLVLAHGVDLPDSQNL